MVLHHLYLFPRCLPLGICHSWLEHWLPGNMPALVAAPHSLANGGTSLDLCPHCSGKLCLPSPHCFFAWQQNGALFIHHKPMLYYCLLPALTSVWIMLLSVSCYDSSQVYRLYCCLLPVFTSSKSVLSFQPVTRPRSLQHPAPALNFASSPSHLTLVRLHLEEPLDLSGSSYLAPVMTSPIPEPV